jgi:uncharacterized RDD family membrane protein YckC
MTMNCPYCRTVNDSAESRCVRCGRRLHGSGRVAESVGNAALAMQPDAPPAPVSQAMMEAPAMDADETQPSLFRDAGPTPKVVPIPTLSPLRSASPLERESVRRNAARAASRSTRPAGLQQSLDLEEQQTEARKRHDDALYCDARVALPTHRAVAAVVDCIVVLSAAAAFGVVAYFFGVNLTLAKSALAVPAAIVLVVTILYRGLWCLANADTPGMRFAGLQLVDFDGRRPRSKSRIVRQFAGILSLASAGVGLLWALVDEESLTWHDHISKTFPTTR